MLTQFRINNLPEIRQTKIKKLYDIVEKTKEFPDKSENVFNKKISPEVFKFLKIINFGHYGHGQNFKYMYLDENYIDFNPEPFGKWIKNYAEDYSVFSYIVTENETLDLNYEMYEPIGFIYYNSKVYNINGYYHLPKTLVRGFIKDKLSHRVKCILNNPVRLQEAIFWDTIHLAHKFYKCNC